MYDLPYYKDKDATTVVAFIKQHPFIVICGADTGGLPVATQIPVLITANDDQLILRGHMMRNTDHHKAFIKHPQVLALFTGPQTYVSASWYSNPRLGSTWNYMSVHARGELKFLDEKELLQILDETTAHFEDNPSSPSLYKELPSSYVEQMSKAIVAFEIVVTDLAHIFKLSQDRDEASYENIISKLSEQTADARQIAAEMRQRKATLFQAGK
jgi:transcriptional regulator